MPKVALCVRLKAKSGKEQELKKFLEGALPLAIQEPNTPAWFALEFGRGSFGIFDAFPNEEGRQAHLNGPIAVALMAKADELLAERPTIEEVDILAAKLPG